MHRHEKIDFWDDVYGFNMKCIKGLAMQEPLVDVVDQEQVATKPCLIATFNLSSMTKEDASFTVRASAFLRPPLNACLLLCACVATDMYDTQGVSLLNIYSLMPGENRRCG